MVELLLANLSRVSHRSESTLLRRYPSGAKALATLKRDGLVQYYDAACSALCITLAGLNSLRRLREARARRAA